MVKVEFLMKQLFIAVAFLFMGCAPSWAHKFTVGDLVIAHPWARPTLGSNSNGVAYMVITNHGVTDDRLVGVNADMATRVELHSTIMDGDVMRMRPVTDGVEIPSGEKLEILPGGLHIMFMGLKAPLKEGGEFPLSLRFEHAGVVDVSVHVENKPEKSTPPEREHHH